MKFKLNERGFILAEFVIALPLLILLLYALGTLTLTAARIAREQVADYVLETEAQEVIDRITRDARAAYSVEIRKAAGDINPDLENIFFKYHILDANLEKDDFRIEDDKYYQSRKVDEVAPKNLSYYKDIITPRIYAVHSTQGGYFHVYSKRQDDDNYSNPVTGQNSYGNTIVTQMKFSKNFLEKKILHITFEMKSARREQKVKFTTAVYMPACEEIIYCGEKIL